MSRSKPACLLHIRLNSCRIQLIKSGVSFRYIAIVACPELFHCSQRCVQLFQSTGWVNKGESHPVLRCHKEHGTITDQLVCLRMSVACQRWSWQTTTRRRTSFLPLGVAGALIQEKRFVNCEWNFEAEPWNTRVAWATDLVLTVVQLQHNRLSLEETGVWFICLQKEVSYQITRYALEETVHFYFGFQWQ